MAEYIERELAKRIVDDIDTWSSGWRDYAKLQMDSIPAADVVARDCYDRLLAENDELRKERPVRRGRWIHVKWHKDETEQEGGYWISRCTACSMPYHSETPFCPHCGAIMDGDGDG